MTAAKKLSLNCASVTPPLSQEQCSFIKWTANVVLISSPPSCFFHFLCCWTWSDLNALLVHSLQWQCSPLSPFLFLSLFQLCTYTDHPLVACHLMLYHLSTIIVYILCICGSADKCPRYPLSRAAWPRKRRHSLQVSVCWFSYWGTNFTRSQQNHT